MKEIWKDIEGYEGLYQVSNLGRVKSLDRIVIDKGNNSHRKGKTLTLTRAKNDYLTVELWRFGKRIRHYVHRLVAENFIPNLLNKREVNHIDCNKHNNTINNLEWVTSNENKVHARKNGLYINQELELQNRWKNAKREII